MSRGRKSEMPETKACENCGKKINLKYSACPLCGGHQSENTNSTTPVCPRCDESLTIHMHDGEEYDICHHCGGMWLDRGEFHRATREFDVYKKEKLEKEYIKKPSRDPLKYVSCVRCSRLMNRKNFKRISGVIIDECKRHGVWLDAGELEKIRHFIADGGLDKAQDREIERNRAALKELATTVKDTAFTQRLIHFWNPKRWIFRCW
jgi:Zn-finger nucleic acid-binding protein